MHGEVQKSVNKLFQGLVRLFRVRYRKRFNESRFGWATPVSTKESLRSRNFRRCRITRREPGLLQSRIDEAIQRFACPGGRSPTSEERSLSAVADSTSDFASPVPLSRSGLPQRWPTVTCRADHKRHRESISRNPRSPCPPSLPDGGISTDWCLRRGNQQAFLRFSGIDRRAGISTFEQTISKINSQASLWLLRRGRMALVTGFNQYRGEYGIQRTACDRPL